MDKIGSTNSAAHQLDGGHTAKQPNDADDNDNTTLSPTVEVARIVGVVLKSLRAQLHQSWQDAIADVQKTLKSLAEKMPKEYLTDAQTEVEKTLKTLREANASDQLWADVQNTVRRALEAPSDASSTAQTEVKRVLNALAKKSASTWQDAIADVQKTLKSLAEKMPKEYLTAAQTEIKNTLEIARNYSKDLFIRAITTVKRALEKNPAATSLEKQSKRGEFNDGLRLLKSAWWLNQYVEGGFRAQDAIRSVIGHKPWEEVTHEDIDILRYKFPSLFESFKEEKTSQPAPHSTSNPLEPLSFMYGPLYMQALTTVGLTAAMMGMSFLSWMPLFFLPHFFFPAFFLA